MKVVFLSSYYSHHQSDFSEEMVRLTNNNYIFVETMPLEIERKELGWKPGENVGFIFNAYEEPQRVRQMINEADVIIWGSVPFAMITGALFSNKIIFRYSERLFKDKGIKSCLRWTKYAVQSLIARNSYLLCASAYAYMDYRKVGAYRDRAYVWGYFPPVDDEENSKPVREDGDSSILWCGRLLKWKHPEMVIALADTLQERGLKFHLDIIGTGSMEELLRYSIQKKGLQKCVSMRGSMSPDCVREYMKKADIFVFTSDYNEGWGAVLNEAMNSRCAVVASHAAGSVPYMVRDGVNACVYENGNQTQLNDLVVELLKDSNKREQLGRNAQHTVLENWNGKVAAYRFLCLCDKIMKNEDTEYRNGLCSHAPDITEAQMYQRIQARRVFEE